MKAFTIAVSQITATVSNHEQQQQQQQEQDVRWLLNRNVESSLFVQVLNVVVETDTHVLSLVRYVPDLIEFDHLIKTHYRRVRVPFPKLTEEPATMTTHTTTTTTTGTTATVNTTADKRRSFRQFLTSLPHSSHRSNAEKIQRYLHKCSLEPVVRSSSIFRDFFSVQRDEDRCVPKAGLKQLQAPLSSTTTTTTKPYLQQEHQQQQQQQSRQREDESPKKYDFFENLEMIKVLGKGCMGKLVIEQREITHTLAERDILATLSEINHPFLAKLHASFQDMHRLYLVTDYYCGGDLATQMSTCSTFSKERTLFYAAEIIDGMGELHRLGVLYRDLKPENILLTADGHVLLTDFGLSKWLLTTTTTNDDDDENDGQQHQRVTQTFCGTAEYLAPEALLGEPYSFGIDHWAYGTILYEMLAGITPFWADNHSEMYRRVLQDPLEFPPDTDFETAEFLSALLERDPRLRLGYNGVDEIKQHMYFSDVDWDQVYQRSLVPPYVPDLRSSLDFSNFDPSFLEMPAVLTPVASAVDLSQEMQQVFDGYSFVDAQF
ncbi:kinase-like domain-containing protein, partial [Zychaea mexicana]|uniref:kinase-like domain-containing protein n=1 Tax=Zychaea mexicana TaxID=64656 RepID=UPI0022FE6809